MGQSIKQRGELPDLARTMWIWWGITSLFIPVWLFMPKIIGVATSAGGWSERDFLDVSMHITGVGMAISTAITLIVSLIYFLAKYDD